MDEWFTAGLSDWDISRDAPYFGFEIPDEFVIGFGMDYAGRYRNLPYVGALRRELYTT